MVSVRLWRIVSWQDSNPTLTFHQGNTGTVQACSLVWFYGSVFGGKLRRKTGMLKLDGIRIMWKACADSLRVPLPAPLLRVSDL